MAFNITISAFGDEIASDLVEQLTTLNDLQIPGLDLRGAWDTNVADMTDEQVAQAKQLCSEHNVAVQCIGSPIGKSPLADPIAVEQERLARVIEIARELGTTNIRIFSFYPADTSTNAHYDQHVAETAQRLKILADQAGAGGCTLQHENEKGIVGDTPERCLALMEAVDSSHMQFIWDPANFVQVGVAKQVDRYWDQLAPYIGYIHIKDSLLADGTVKPAGQGDGQLPELLANLKAMGYEGVLSLEPHLAIAGHSSGFTGVEGMGVAVGALRDLLAELDA